MQQVNTHTISDRVFASRSCNILFSDLDTLKICDLGVATARTIDNGEELTSAYTIIGSPLYMAPEQVRNHCLIRWRERIQYLFSNQDGDTRQKWMFSRLDWFSLCDNVGKGTHTSEILATFKRVEKLNTGYFRPLTTTEKASKMAFLGSNLKR